MCPFVGRPPGFSSETLEMLDRTLSAIWQEKKRRDQKPAKYAAEPGKLTVLEEVEVIKR